MSIDSGIHVLSESITSHVLRTGRVDPRLTQWLTDAPVSLALQIALVRTYTACARNYPEFADVLFEELPAGKSASKLAKVLVGQRVDPALFAQLLPDSKGNPGLRTRVAADILHWFESELKSAPVFKPLFDPAALDSLPDLEARRDQLADELQRALKLALDPAQRDTGQVIAGERGVAIAGNLSNSVIVTGDNNTAKKTSTSFCSG